MAVSKVLRWIWASWETLSLWQWLTGPPVGAAGFGGLKMLEFTASWPLGVLALVSAGIALVWLTFWGWLLRRQEPSLTDRQLQEHSTHAQQAANTGGNVTQVSGDQATIISGDQIVHNYGSLAPKPIFTVAEEHDGNWWGLRIQNDGAVADIRVQVTVLAGIDKFSGSQLPQRYYANWYDNVTSQSKHLLTRESAEVTVGLVMSNRDEKHYLRLIWVEANGQVRTADSTRECHQGVILEITLLSSLGPLPPMRYRFGLDGLQMLRDGTWTFGAV